MLYDYLRCSMLLIKISLSLIQLADTGKYNIDATKSWLVRLRAYVIPSPSTTSGFNPDELQEIHTIFTSVIAAFSTRFKHVIAEDTIDSVISKKFLESPFPNVVRIGLAVLRDLDIGQCEPILEILAVRKSLGPDGRALAESRLNKLRYYRFGPHYGPDSTLTPADRQAAPGSQVATTNETGIPGISGKSAGTN